MYEWFRVFDDISKRWVARINADSDAWSPHTPEPWAHTNLRLATLNTCIEVINDSVNGGAGRLVVDDDKRTRSRAWFRHPPDHGARALFISQPSMPSRRRSAP